MKKLAAVIQLVLIFALLVGVQPAYSQKADAPHIKDAKNQIDYQVKKWNQQYDTSKNQKTEPQKIDAAATQTFYDKLLSGVKWEQRAEVAAVYMKKLNESGVVSKEAWCALYKKIREGASGDFHNVKSDEWTEIDKLARSICPQPKAEDKGIKEGPCPEGYPLIDGCLGTVQSPAAPCTATLVGDGVNTNNCKLLLTNARTGQQSVADLKTVCASLKTMKPPQEMEKAKPLQYVLTKPDPAVVKILKNAKELEKAGAYEGVAFPAKRRLGTISQLAIWKHFGGSAEGSADAVNPASIKEDLLKRAGIKESALTDEEKKDIDKRVDLIFEKVDLTEKGVPEIPGKPVKPDEPGRPVKPDEPGKPTKPDEPGKPVKPDEPGKPVKPDEPGKPTKPDEPGKPVKPEEPGKPTKPDEPGQPTEEIVCIPPYTTFHCLTEGFQDMTVTEMTTTTCPGMVINISGGHGDTDNAGGGGTGGGPAIAEGCPLVGKPVYDESCTWRIWKIMRVTKKPGWSLKEWEDKMLELGKEKLPETGGNILGAKVNSLSKVKQLMDDENKLDTNGLDTNERIVVFAVCIGPEGYVDQERVFEMTNYTPFKIQNLSSLDKYPDFHNKREQALRDLENQLNTKPPPPPWKL